MNTYEVTKADGSTASLAASGYSMDMAGGTIRFYDSNANQVAFYRKGEWTALHMRSALLKADAPKTTGIKSDEFALYHGH